MFKKKLWLLGICMCGVMILSGLTGCTTTTRTTTTATTFTTKSTTTSLRPTASTLTASQTTSSTTSEPMNIPIVQVLIPGSNGGTDVFEALGVPVGDGTTILTIINYEDYSPRELKVMSPGGAIFTATIQAIDARTGATLLKLDSGKLLPVTTRDPTTLNANEQLIVWDQSDSDSTLESTSTIGPNVSPDSSALDFSIVLPEGVQNSGGVTQGAVVVDQSGNVLGLESIWGYTLVMRTGYPGFIPPIISINCTTELLSPIANQLPWANSPHLFSGNVIGPDNRNHNGNYLGYDRDYLPVASAVTRVLNELGGATSITDLPQEYLSYSIGNQATESSDGSLLTMVFPRPVNLCNSSGTVLAQAKWVGIQWDRSGGKTSRVIYGSSAYVVQGSFEITGDTGSLENSAYAMLTDSNPYNQ